MTDVLAARRPASPCQYHAVLEPHCFCAGSSQKCQQLSLPADQQGGRDLRLMPAQLLSFNDLFVMRLLRCATEYHSRSFRREYHFRSFRRDPLILAISALRAEDSLVMLRNTADCRQASTCVSSHPQKCWFGPGTVTSSSSCHIRHPVCRLSLCRVQATPRESLRRCQSRVCR